MNPEDKINIVKNILENKKVAIGFSGGADSTLLAYLSCEVAQDTLAITVDNHLMPANFIKNTENIVKDLKIKHEIISIDFYEDKEFLLNDSKRCYNCRSLMYEKIKELAVKKGFDFICDGNNISDLIRDRPGILITYENDFKTPFIEARLTSKEIHEYLNTNNIAYSKSTTCLATRIPTDTQITAGKIKKIQGMEDYIMTSTNCEIVKVRDYDENCIVEVDNISEILTDNKFKQINDELKSHGFKKVCLNLSQIEDNEYIKLGFSEGSFSYRLPFTLNIDNTKKQIENIITYDKYKIQTDKITVFENGIIKGHDFKDYENALDAFMEILPKLRRNI